VNPYLQDADVTLYLGDALSVLRELPSESVHCCVTSPPFYGLRNYNVEGQIGLEETPEQWVEKLVAVFREVKRVLRKDGTLWLEVGDSYYSNPAKGGSGPGGKNEERWGYDRRLRGQVRADTSSKAEAVEIGRPPVSEFKPKDLIGAPWLLAFALRADGWYLRSDIVWSRPNPMPESVTDRPTKSHSYLFLLSRSPRYFFDQEAVREQFGPHGPTPWGQNARERDPRRRGRRADACDSAGESDQTLYFCGDPREEPPDRLSARNIRSVWSIATEAFPDAHFATFPQELARRCILAGTSERGCCPECGAPWVRQTSHEYEWYREPRDDREWRATAGPARDGRTKGLANKHVTTTGWHPSCECGALPEGTTVRECDRNAWRNDCVPSESVPCTVLDPFCGSGTTNLVARNLGRRSIGIDLSLDYLKLAAQKRLAQQSLLAEAT
jgi:DNA modification methylase